MRIPPSLAMFLIRISDRRPHLNRRLRSFVVLASAMTVALLCPATVHGAFWGWLGELSGPGPFAGPTYSVEMLCLPSAERAKAAGVAPVSTTPETPRKRVGCHFDRDDAKIAIHFEYSPTLDDRPEERNPAERYQGDTDLIGYRGVVYTPVGFGKGLSTSWGRALQRVEVGVGLGAYRITGDTLLKDSLTPWVAPVRVRVFPVEFIYALVSKGGVRAYRDAPWGRRYARVIEYRAGWDVMLSNLDPNDFRVAKPKAGRGEWIPTGGFQVDALALWQAVVNH